jgi:hypothetical protein
VYLGVDEATGDYVVIKRPRARLGRSLRAAEIAVCREEHDHLARVIDDGVDAVGSYIVEEHIDGVSVSELVRAIQLAAEDMPVRIALAIALRVAQGLRTLHDTGPGWTHHDVAASNVMLTPSGRVVLIDFDAAQRHGEPGHVFAHEGYLAPERRGGCIAAPSSDVYALGVLTFFMLTGSVETPEPGLFDPVELRDDVPPAVCDLVLRCTAEVPAARVAGAGDVIEAIERIGAAERGVLARYVRSFFGDGGPTILADPCQPIGIACESSHLSFRVRGAAIRATIVTVQTRFGDSGYEKVLACSRAPTRDQLREPIAPSEWYDGELFVDLTRAACAVFGAGVVALLGADSARHALGQHGMYRVFAQAGERYGAHRFVEGSSTLFRLYYDRGEWRVEELLPGYSRCRFVSGYRFPPEIRERVLAFLEQGLKLCGADHFEIEQTADGDDLVVSFTWTQDRHASGSARH